MILFLLLSTLTWAQSTETGLIKVFDRSGKNLREISYVETAGRLPKMNIRFYENGSIEEIKCGEKAYGEEDAKFCGFNAPNEIVFKNFKGDVKRKETYDKGKLVHLVTLYSSGKVHQDAVLVGEEKTMKVFFEDGLLQTEAVELNRKPVWEKEYYINGKLKTEANYTTLGDNTVLTRKTFFNTGKIAQESQLVAAGLWSSEFKVGESKKYHDNGKVESLENYDKFGNLEGESLYYDNSGRLLRKKTFARNKLIKEERIDN